MEKFFYFRDATDEATDLSAAVSATVPVNRITGITVGGTTTINIWFKSLKNEMQNERAALTVTLGKLKEVMATLVQAMNGGPHSDGFVVIADTVTTTDGASSIQGDDQAVSAKFIHGDITNIALLTY